MKVTFKARVMPLMTAAIKSACSPLSITHGPAIRNRSPEPTRTLSSWKDTLMFLTTESPFGSAQGRLQYAEEIILCALGVLYGGCFIWRLSAVGGTSPCQRL